jgi:hypothetical protein
MTKCLIFVCACVATVAAAWAARSWAGGACLALDDAALDTAMGPVRVWRLDTRALDKSTAHVAAAWALHDPRSVPEARG